MNTKGIKFLAVLAVMVMAFAAIVVLAPADKDVVAVDVSAADVKVDPDIIKNNDGFTKYYISDDAIVKVESVAPGTIIYVQNGKELELDFKNGTTNAITVKSVTSDIERHTTSTVDEVVNPSQVGKIVLDNSELTFVGKVGQSVIYTAMEPKVKTTFTTSVIVNVTTTGKYATVSSDVAFDAATTTIQSNVAVANNQSIEVEGTSTNGTIAPYYGVKITDAPASSTGKTVTTYYAAGMSVGSFNMEQASDAVAILNGSVNAKNGNASIKASHVYAYSEVTITRSTSADQLTLTGSIYSGDVVANGTVAMGGNGVTINDYATLTLSNGSVASGTVIVDGTLILKCEKTGIEGLTINGTGIVKADNKALWTYTTTAPIIPSIELGEGNFSGLVDVYTITEIARVTDRFSTAEIAPDQTFQVVGDTTVTNSLTVKGILIIDEGVTLTINKVNNVGAAIIFQDEYSQLINNGTILIKTAVNGSNDVGLHIHGGLAVNYGKIDAKSDANSGTTFGVDFTATQTNNGKGIGFINYGDITISKNDVMKLTDRFVNEGSLTLSGSLTSEIALKNGGIFTLSNATLNYPMTVKMSMGAEFNVVSAKFTGADAAANTITVANYGPNEDTGATEIKSSIAIAGVNAAQIRGIDIIDSTTVKSTGTTYKLNLNGNVGVSGLTGENKVTMTLGKGIEVKDSVNVSKGYEMAFGTGATLAVSGEMTFADGVTVSANDNISTATNLTLTATGTVTSMTNDVLDGCKLSGAKYNTVGSNSVFYYTTMDDAIVGAIAADVNLIEVGSKGATITTSTIIPSGMVITEDANTAVLSIGDSDNMVEVTVASDVAFSFTKHVKVVNGAIIMANVNDLDENSVDADVKEVDSESNAAAYMSLGYALANAESGDEITICQKVVITSETVVIPEGVVVDTVGNNVALVLIDSNLEVDGKLKVQNFYFVANTDDDRYITVDGTIMDYDEDGAAITPWWYTPLGVSYKTTITDDNGNEHTWYVITNLSKIQEAINTADGAEVTVEGDVVLDELNVQGRDDMAGTVNFNGDVDIDTITIDEVTLNFEEGTKISTTVRNAVGAITITGAYADDNLSIFDMAIYSTEEVGVYMEGIVTDGDDGTYGILFEGITGMDSTDVKTSISYGNYDDNTPTIVFDGVTTVIGKKTFINMEDELDDAMVTITGTLTAYNNSKLTINSDVQVLGALAAAERTEEAVAGTVETTGNIFVGMLASDIYDMDYYYDTTADAAILSGKVALAATKFIYVAPAAIVDPAIAEDLDTMNIYVDDEVWFTLYGHETTGVFSLKGLCVPSFNANIYTILDENDEKLNCTVDANKPDVIATSPERTLSAFGNVYIVLDYNIFEVKIKTDGSVKAVYIDGILMETGQSMNIFTMMNVAAGTHKVNVEAATGYDADKCVLYTEMGTILPNMGFTFTELDVTEYDYIMVDEKPVKVPVVVYNINGTEIQPEPVPPTPEEESQWTVTTILLVILVVLIAIMAVIVALRLNRS